MLNDTLFDKLKKYVDVQINIVSDKLTEIYDKYNVQDVIAVRDEIKTLGSADVQKTLNHINENLNYIQNAYNHINEIKEVIVQIDSIKKVLENIDTIKEALNSLDTMKEAIKKADELIEHEKEIEDLYNDIKNKIENQLKQSLDVISNEVDLFLTTYQDYKKDVEFVKDLINLETKGISVDEDGHLVVTLGDSGEYTYALDENGHLILIKE